MVRALPFFFFNRRGREGEEMVEDGFFIRVFCSHLRVPVAILFQQLFVSIELDVSCRVEKFFVCILIGG